MKRSFERIIRFYGCQVTLEGPKGTKTLRAFLRPVTSRSLHNLRREMDELGMVPGGQYVFIGPADCGLEEAELVLSAGKRYAPRRVERLLIGEEAVCVWGLLAGEGGEDPGTFD